MKNYSFCLFRNWLTLMVKASDFDKTESEKISEKLNKFAPEEVEFVFRENKKVNRDEEYHLRLYYVDGDVELHLEDIKSYLESKLGLEERAIAYGLRKT